MTAIGSINSQQLVALFVVALQAAERWYSVWRSHEGGAA
jgi:hypothetical protein